MSLSNQQAGQRPYTFAYYCSGHGYGHATRVVALTHELLLRSHSVHICTNAPQHVFASAIKSGAAYRHAEIDAGIVQPKAYDVARQETVDGLKKFSNKREQRVLEEAQWLQSIKADAVLVDAPFLPCAAATLANIPSVIISNFTFDSCYSYLSVSTEADHASLPLSKTSSSTCSVYGQLSPPSSESGFESEDPIPPEILEPLVNQAIADYSNASLLLRLPGAIPIPAFDKDVPLPAPLWTDLKAHSFKQEIKDLLARDPATVPCRETKDKSRRRVVQVPLITREVSKDAYSQEARSRLLSSIGVPEHQHDPASTKILVVSFGGQSIPRPASRPPTPRRGNSPELAESPTEMIKSATIYQKNGALSPPTDLQVLPGRPSLHRLMTTDHLYLPGAPPTLNPQGLLRYKHKLAIETDTTRRFDNDSARDAVVNESEVNENAFDDDDDEEELDGLLPPGWIAIVCGLPAKDLEEELPPNFYAAPRDVYVPDLTANCDVLLGKLGYGTCSETVSTQTPFIYVPRPLFVEEFGLKRLMETSGTSLPMSRSDFEAGRWSNLVMQAWKQGRDKKAAAREKHMAGESELKAATVIAEELEGFMRS